MHLVGNVTGKQVIIIDDIIDTAGTLCEATKVLKEMGALNVSCFATHGLFSGNAIENIQKSRLDQVIVTNTVPPKEKEEELTGGKITRLSVAPILAEAIFRIQTKTSISSLFSIPKT
jgi:ribose-phosphate pyrophosphokinase